MNLTHSQNKLDIEALVKKEGYRNFRSFIAMSYYDQKYSLKQCAELIGISSFTIKNHMKKNGFEVRQPGPLPGTVPVNSGKKNLGTIVRSKTYFKSAKVAIGTMYMNYHLNTYEIAETLGVSQTFICKKLKEYGINTRKQGKYKLRR